MGGKKGWQPHLRGLDCSPHGKSGLLDKHGISEPARNHRVWAQKGPPHGHWSLRTGGF